MRKILIIAAHPDDEILGCGGFMAKSAKSGIEVKSIFMTNGESSRFSSGQTVPKEIMDRRKNSAKSVARFLGCHEPVFYDFPDNAMDGVRLLQIVQVIEQEIQDFKPDTVLTHVNSDLNIDHRITSNAVITATRPIPNNLVKNTIFFEIPSSTEWNFNGDHNSFEANFYVDISKVVKMKKICFEMYSYEMREPPHPRSWKIIEAKHLVNGSQIGVEKAERFIIGRVIK